MTGLATNRTRYLSAVTFWR